MGRRLREKCTCERENDNIISYDWTNLSEGVIIITTDGGRRKIVQLHPDTTLPHPTVRPQRLTKRKTIRIFEANSTIRQRS